MGGQTPYYWPTKGSLVFAGYSPASANGTFNFDFANKTFTATDYIQSNNIADAKDLMWFDVTNESYDQNGADDKGVPVEFQHALSWLTFKFNLKDERTAANWTITDVTLNGIEDKATFTAVKDGDMTWTEAEKSDDGKDVVNVYNAGEGTGYTVNYIADAAVLSGTDQGDKVKTNAVLVIPQSCAKDDASIVITYNMKTYVGDGVLTGQTVELPLEGDQIDDNKWEPGKHYIYTITFGANEILIAPTVTVWDTVEVDPINVQ